MLPACRRLRRFARARFVDVRRPAPSAFRHLAIAEAGSGSRDSVTILPAPDRFFIAPESHSRGTMKLLTFVAFAAAMTFMVPAFGAAQPAAPAAAPAAGTISGTVRDARKRPVAGASVDVRRGEQRSTVVTAGDGTFTLAVAPGLYDVVVRKGGFQSAEDPGVTVLGGTATPINVTLVEATTSNLRVIGTVSTRSTARSTIAAVSSLPAATLVERQSTTLQEVLPEIPGVTFNRGQSVDPYEFFAVRGGLTETRVQLDGHPVVPAVGGKWNLAEINPQVFGGADVYKGAGIDSGANAGESVFGTLNLRTRDFTPTNRAEIGAGVDEYGAQFSTFAASGNALRDNRLSYVLDYNVAGTVGPEDGALVNAVLVDPVANPGQAVIGYQSTLDDRIRSTSELAKLRYRLSDATSVSAAYVGFQGVQNPQGIAYGTSVGAVTIVPTIDGQYNAPYAQNLIGHTVTGYQWFPGTTTAINEPFFEAELRTTFKNDTLLLRPYTGVVDRIVNGDQEVFFTAPQFGQAWNLNPDGTYSPNLGSVYEESEVNRLHGVTFNYLHPFGENTLNFSYDYHSVYSSSYFGDPNPATNTAHTVNGDTYEISVAPTTARTNDLSLSTALTVAPNLKLGLGEYFTLWKLDYLVEDPAIVAANPTVDFNDLPISLVGRSRSYGHTDPHIGLNYRPNAKFALRASAGSGITVPYASQVSGLPSVSNASGTSNGQAVLTNVNPNLNPETTVAYDLGADVVLPATSLLSVDLFHNTIHNPFLLSTFPVTAPPNTPRPYSEETQWLNGPIARAYGFELSLRSPERRGWGYNLTGTLERAYYDQIPPSFYALAASNAVNGAQLNGDNIIPYAQGHAELRWIGRDVRTAFGADYTGANNWTYGPAYATFFFALQKDVGHVGKLRISVDNLFNHGNGDPYGVAIQNGGFSTYLLGPNASGTGLAGSSLAQAFQSIPPRTFRFSLSKTIGGP
jgi:outer membrane receptor protein involved in Fe transport